MVLVWLFIIFIQNVSAIEPQRVSFNTSTESASDDLLLQKYNIEYSNHRRNLFWNYNGVHEEANDYGAELNITKGILNSSFKGFELELFYGKKIDFNTYVQMSIGHHHLDAAIKTQIIPYSFNYQKVYEKINIDFKFKSDFFYNETASQVPVSNGLIAKTFNLGINYSPASSVRIPFNVRKSIISDGNISTNATLSVMYGSSYPKWIWIGIGFQNMGHDNNKAGYWSPESFYSYGPKLEFSTNITANTQAGFSINEAIIKEKNFNQGRASSYSVSASYGDRNTKKYTIQASHNKSAQGSGLWESKSAKFNCEVSF